ncbi:integrase core domain protein [Plakobranchus ocellatus]|uniref:Integrase core domain protein n=1 Tax=Plakobranchus ocellatus TaxID=259542 RepID=A0AAV4DYD6_9GAST|nr:integrase core domain protein [Plakobranchus ocellatus]
MVNYYSRFIKDLATTAEPLRRLTRKNVRFSWTAACQSAFDKIKHAIANSVRSFIFDPNAPTFVTTDASDVGLGAVLIQTQQGREVPIAHISHTLQPRERSYAVNEKEALACVWACETWEKYLLGRHFTLRTDHSSLASLLRSTTDSRNSAKFTRWLDRLSPFDYTVEYRQGKHNLVADALSRLSMRSAQSALHHPTHDHVVGALQTDHLSLLDVKSATKRDSTLSTVLHFVSSGWPIKKSLAPDIQQFFAVRDELQTEDQCLLRENRIVLPTALRRRLLAKAHEGHPGIVGMKRKLRQSYWWPGQDKDIENFVKHCAGCQLSDKSLAPANVSPNSIPLPESSWQKVAIDVTGPFLIAPQSSKFLVVLIDYKSKFPEILMASKVRSLTIIGWLDEIFSRFGASDELVSDNGPQFISMEFTNFLQKYNIHHTLTAVYNPQENGCVERFNQYLKHGIQAFHASGEAWASGIQALLLNYRATAATPPGRSPGEVMFHRSLRLPFQISASAHRARPPSPQLATSASDEQGVHSRGPYRVGDRVLACRP